jgi:hypothetical protein
MPLGRANRDPFPSMMPSALRSPSLLGRASVLAFVAVLVMTVGCAPRGPNRPAPAAEPVTFVKLAPRVGRVAIEEHSIEFRLEGEARPEGRAANRVRSKSTQRERRREEILAVFERIVTKKKITFERIEHSEDRNGSEVTAPKSPLVGRSYVVELKQSEPIFTDALGAPVSDVEKRELSRRLANFGKPDPFLESLPDGPVQPGWPASGIAAGFLELFEPADEASLEGPDIANVDVRYAGVRDEPQGRCGVFAFTLAIQMAGEPRLGLDLKGEFLVRVSDSAPIALEARGPAHLVGLQVVEGVNVQMRGAGEMIGSFRVTYL